MCSELTPLDLLEYALQLVERKGGSPGMDGQTIQSITAKPEIRPSGLMSGRSLTVIGASLSTRRLRPTLRWGSRRWPNWGK